MRYGPCGVELYLHEGNQLGRLAALVEGFGGRRSMAMDRKVELRTYRPKRFVPGVVQVGHLEHVVARKQHSAQPSLFRPSNLGDRVIDVVEKDLGKARSTIGSLIAEVSQPPVVGP